MKNNNTITNNNTINTVTMKKTFITTAMVLATCIAPFAKTNDAKNPTAPTTNSRDKKDLGTGDFAARDKKDLGTGDFQLV
jgi:hypothetical protein